VTCGNGEDDVSLVSDPTNILDNVDTTILSVIKVVE